MYSPVDRAELGESATGADSSWVMAAAIHASRDAAVQEAHAKLLALLASPTREGAVEAIAASKRATATMERSRAAAVKQAEKDKAKAAKEKEAILKAKLKAKLKAQAKRSKAAAKKQKLARKRSAKRPSRTGQKQVGAGDTCRSPPACEAPAAAGEDPEERED